MPVYCATALSALVLVQPGLFMAFDQQIIIGMGFFRHADGFKMFLSFKVKFDIQHAMDCNHQCNEIDFEANSS